MAEKIFTEQQVQHFRDLKEQLEEADRVLPGRLREMIDEVQSRNPGIKIDFPDIRAELPREYDRIEGARKLLMLLLADGDESARWTLVTGLNIEVKKPTPQMTSPANNDFYEDLRKQGLY